MDEDKTQPFYFPKPAHHFNNNCIKPLPQLPLPYVTFGGWRLMCRSPQNNWIRISGGGPPGIRILEKISCSWFYRDLTCTEVTFPFFSSFEFFFFFNLNLDFKSVLLNCRKTHLCYRINIRTQKINDFPKITGALRL